MNIKARVNMHEGSTNVGVFDAAGKIYCAMLFFRDDDRVEVFNEDEESIGLIYTSSSDVLFNDKQIGRVRYAFPKEDKQTIKMVLYKDNNEEEIVESNVSVKDMECFLKAEQVFTKYLIENNIITVPEVQ